MPLLATVADSVSCRQCPQGTFSPDTGLQDQSMCQPCPYGRICGVEGMDVLEKSDYCPAGHVCGQAMSKREQFDHPSPAGYYTSNQETPVNQFNSICEKGNFCPRGTKSFLRNRNKCKVGYFCPDGSTLGNMREQQCPFMCNTPSGGKSLEECNVVEVDVCDKQSRVENSYISRHAYRLGPERKIFDSLDPSTETRTGEMQVARKVRNIVNRTASDPANRNETVEVFHVCPQIIRKQDIMVWNKFRIQKLGTSYTPEGLNSSQLDNVAAPSDNITIIGRNFRDSPFLTCRFTPVPPALQPEGLVKNRSMALGLYNEEPRMYSQKSSEADAKPLFLKHELFAVPPAWDALQHTLEEQSLVPEHWSPWNFFQARSYRRASHCPGAGYSLNVAGELWQSGTGGCAKGDRHPDLQARMRPNVELRADGTRGRVRYKPSRLSRAAFMPATFISSTRVSCAVPPFTGTGAFRVEVSNDGIHFAEAEDKERYPDVYIAYNNVTNGDFSSTKRDPTADATNNASICKEYFSTGTVGASVASIERERPYEEDWYVVPAFQQAQISFDFRHIPAEMTYEDHYRIAVYVRPSICSDQKCRAGTRERIDFQIAANQDALEGGSETGHCTKPIRLPESFTIRRKSKIESEFGEWENIGRNPDGGIDKHDLLKFSFTPSEDVIVKTEIQILHAMFLTVEPYFYNTTTVHIYRPLRARMVDGLSDDKLIEKRKLSKDVSFERRRIPKDYIFVAGYSFSDHYENIWQPYNLPERFQERGKGRVLVDFNRTLQEGMPVVLDELVYVEEDIIKRQPLALGVVKPTTYIEAEGARIKASTKKYREIHSQIECDGEGCNMNTFQTFAVPYALYFSNCDGFDSHMPLWRLMENENCELPGVPTFAEIQAAKEAGESTAAGRTWARRKFGPFPHIDDIRTVDFVTPFTEGRFEPIADLCTFSVQCNYEEDLSSATTSPRWYEADTDSELFTILRKPMPTTDFMFEKTRYLDYDENLFVANEVQELPPMFKNLDNAHYEPFNPDCTEMDMEHRRKTCFKLEYAMRRECTTNQHDLLSATQPNAYPRLSDDYTVLVDEGVDNIPLSEPQECDDYYYDLAQESAAMANDNPDYTIDAETIRGSYSAMQRLTDASPDNAVSVSVDKEAASDMDRSCEDGCVPRSVTLEIRYYQITTRSKQLVTATVILDEFDFNTADTGYTFTFEMKPLDWIELIIEFQFDVEWFALFFAILGAATLTVAAIFYLVHRATTEVDLNKFRFRYFDFLLVMALDPIMGMLVAQAPSQLLFYMMIMLTLYGPRAMPFSFWFGPNGAQSPVFFDLIPVHYMDAADNKIDPTRREATRAGRFGTALFVLSLCFMLLGTYIFLPKRVSKREKEILLKRDKAAAKETIWVPTLWKQSNMFFTSLMMGMFLVVLVEFSLWDSFGEYIWYMIMSLKIVAVFVEMIVDYQLKETLLISPIMTAFDLIAGLVTFGADDFVDFLLSYVVEFFIMLVERCYWEPIMMEFITDQFEEFAKIASELRKMLGLKTKTSLELSMEMEEQGKKLAKQREVEQVNDSEDTIEPILEAYGSYANATVALIYQPFLINMMQKYTRVEYAIPVLYGIKEQDMAIYLIFSLIILVFQLLTDVFIHNAQELFHGWKVYDYLVYSRYRFLQREARWKGFEDSLDECIDEGLRTLDQMCFSSQFYFMNAIHANGIYLMIMAVECMVRVNHNMFGDPITVVLAMIVPSLFYLTLYTFTELFTYLGLWKLKHEDTAWHSRWV